MNKTNVFRSSDFHMDVGDVLHIYIIDEAGVPVTVTLNTEGDSLLVPLAPTALEESDVTSASFTANWSLSENATGYYLDVAEDSAFTIMVAGYDNKDVGWADSDSVVGLNDAFTYYYRVRAYNENGTSENSNVIEALTDVESIVDGDGNVYTYVTIGTQQWLIENLKTTKYIDGTAIPNLTLDVDWMAEDGTPGHDGAYCWYNNDIANKTDYGALYNWYAVDNAHGLAPIGWKIPDANDFGTLITFLGGNAVSGGKLKEIGTAHWSAPNTGATDDYGFMAVPGGRRSPAFIRLLEYCYFWVTDPTPPATATVLLYNSETRVESVESEVNGFSIRCMRDL